MTPPSPAPTGIVLAGGRSTRMGQDKAVVRVGGRRLVDLAVDVLAPVCSEVVVAAGERVLPDLAVAQVHDSGEDGPLGGIVTGLGYVDTELAAVVAVDMPFADAALLVDLARRWSGEVAVVPRTGERLQPLHAVYATAAVGRLADALRRGERSPTRAVLDLGALIVDVEDDRFAHNLNAAADLVALEEARLRRSS